MIGDLTRLFYIFPESEEDLITVTDNWRVEIKRVYRQMNDMYENMATWEVVIVLSVIGLLLMSSIFL